MMQHATYLNLPTIFSDYLYKELGSQDAVKRESHWLLCCQTSARDILWILSLEGRYPEGFLSLAILRQKKRARFQPCGQK